MTAKDIIQKNIFEEIENLLQRNGEKSSSILSKTLGISKAALHRRVRLETDLTLEDLFKLRQHFGISIDALLSSEVSKTYFDYQPMVKIDFCLESYFDKLLQNMRLLHEQQHPEMILTINNTPFFTFFNFPHLLKAKLFFWVKNQMAIPEMKDKKYEDFVFSSNILKKANELLKLYHEIPTKELYDPDMLRGFVREIYHYYSAREINSETATQLYRDLIRLVKHLKAQATYGFKYEYGKNGELNSQNKLEVYYNDILNASAVFYYKTKFSEGLFIAQNFLNPVHVTDKVYVHETNQVLINMMSSSSKISITNSKTRSAYFDEVSKFIEKYKRKVLADREFLEIT